MKLESSNINEIFQALNAQIGVSGGVRINLVICGGTALAALGLIERTTRDADVLGIIEMAKNKAHIFSIKKFPDWLTRAAQVVARDFGLPANWLNRDLQARLNQDCQMVLLKDSSQRNMVSI